MLKELERLLDLPDIIGRVDHIEPVIQEIEDNHPNLLQQAVNMIKDAVQQEALDAILLLPTGGVAAMATGTGKSKIPINYIKQNFFKGMKILLIVPTEKLRDENWHEEFKKWGAEDIYLNNVMRTCYASLGNLAGMHFDVVIGDEFHNITEAKETFFALNTIGKGFYLTATMPKDPIKVALINRLGIQVAYTVALDDAVKLRLVSPYEVTVVEVRMNDKDKTIAGGSKDNPFFQTEASAYAYKCSVIRKAMYDKTPKGKALLQYKILDRMRFIKDLESKANCAKFILENCLSKEDRTLIFAGSIEQSQQLCPFTFFSPVTAKPSDKPDKKARAKRIMETYQGEKSYNLFQQGKINRLAAVDKLNEGMNIPELDNILVVQVSSTDTDIIQRIGRLIRYRIGHIGRVIIIVCVDTKDLEWFNKATVSLDQSKIRRVRFENIVSGSEPLFIERIAA